MGAKEDAYLMLLADEIAQKEIETEEHEKLYNEVHAMIVDLNEEGQVKVRIPGVHNVNTPLKDLPWVDIKNPSFANSGVGEKYSPAFNQWVMLRDVSDGLGMSYEAVSGSPLKDSEKKDKQEFKYNKSGSGSSTSSSTSKTSTDENNKPFDWDIEKNLSLVKEQFPKIFSAIPEKLKDTLHALIQMKLLKILMGSPGGPSEPEPPQGGWEVKAKDLDFSNDPEKIIDREGGVVCKLTDELVAMKDVPDNSGGIITVPTKFDPQDYILNFENDSDKKVIGYDKEGNQVFATFDNWELLIPSNVYYYDLGSDPDNPLPPPDCDTECDPNDCQSCTGCYYDYTIIYSIEPKEAAAPRTKSIGTIKFRVCNKIKKTKEQNQSKIKYNNFFKYGVSSTAVTPQYKLDEHESESPKGKSQNKSGFQLSNGSSFEYDSSEDNAYIAYKHPSGSRIDMHHGGGMTMKSNSNMQVLSEGKMHLYSNSSFNLASTTFISTKAPTFFHEGNLVFDGNLHVTGDVIINGNVTIDKNLEVGQNVNITGICKAQDFIATGNICLTKHDHMTSVGDPVTGNC